MTEARDDALASGITINGLPMMLNRPNMGYPEVEPLDAYYTRVRHRRPGRLRDPGSRRDQFIDAMRTKILLEIELARRRAFPPMSFGPSSARATC